MESNSDCVDIDECLVPDVCGENTQCENAPGGFGCACSDGFQRNSESFCQDVDECLNANPCDSNGNCQNTIGEQVKLIL